MDIPGGLDKLMQQAKEMQSKLQSAQEELANLVVVGESGGGLVKVEMNGRHDARNVSIDASLLIEDKDVLEDLIAAAINDAVRKVEKSTGERMKGLAKGINLPDGFDMPMGSDDK